MPLVTLLPAYDALFLVTAIMTFGVPKIAPDYRRQTAFLYLMPICYGLVHTFRSVLRGFGAHIKGT